jgi:hypothetical protein
MATDRKDLKDLWVQWTRDAMSKYVPPEDAETVDDLVDDMIETASQYASGMLDEYEATFGEDRGGDSRHRRSSEGRSRRRTEEKPSDRDD